MKKQKFTKVFTLNELDAKINDENSSIHLHRIKDHMALHPYYLSDLNNSIKEILNKRIGKYFDQYDGILCGYKNITFLLQTGYIFDDSCFIHVDIEADFFIFKPAPQKVLDGVVNKKSKDHIGCLVHNLFNVSLPKPKHEHDWIGDSLSIGSEISLQITQTNFDGKLPYIKGQIISAVGICNEQENGSVDEVVTTKTKKKKAKKRTRECQDEENQDFEKEIISPPKKKKRKEKQ